MELEGHSLQSQTDGGSKNLLLFAGGIAALNGFAQANADAARAADWETRGVFPRCIPGPPEGMTGADAMGREKK